MCDAGRLLGERNWHKPHPNGIQKQRSVNEVLIAFIKTLTKELKWQEFPSPHSRVTEKHVTPKNVFTMMVKVSGLSIAETTLDKY